MPRWPSCMRQRRGGTAPRHPPPGGRGTMRHNPTAERRAGPRPKGGRAPARAGSRLGGRARIRHASATSPAEPSLVQVLLVTALGAAAAAILIAVARSTAGDAAVTPVVTACVRAASYVGLVMAAGSTAFVTVVWPRGRTDRRLALMVWYGWLTIGGATLLQLALHEGAGLLVPGGDRIANALGLRLRVLLASVVGGAALLRGRPAARLLPLGRTAALARVLARFSRLATVNVGVLAASGPLHAVSRAGSAGRLFDTAYGYAFWLKVAAVGAMLVVANGNRRYVLRHVRSATPAPAAVRAAGNGDGGRERSPHHSPPYHSAPPLHMLALFLGAEIAFGVVVMVLTAVLVGAPVSR